MGSHFKMNPQSLLIHLFALYSVCYSQITLDDDQEARPVSGEDVDTRLFNINLGTLDLGNVAGTALGTTLGNLGTGFLQDCFGIGKRSIIMDQLVNRRRRNPQEVSDEVPDVDSRIIGEDGVNSRIFCTGGGGFGGGYSRPNCRTCNCNYDNRCYNVCDKCYQGGGYGYSANSNSGSGGYSNSNNSGSSFGSSGSYGNSNSVNCRTCWCNDWNCKRSCGKCSSGSYRSGEESSDSSSSSNSDAVNFGDA